MRFPTGRTFASLLVFSLAALVGCGSDVSTTGSGGAGGSGSGSGGSDSGSGGAGGTGGTGGGEDCSTYQETPGAPTMPVTVRLVNATGADLFLGSPTSSCGGHSPFSIEDPAGGPLKHELDACEQQCHSLLSSGCACAADCAIPLVTRIVDGGSFEAFWNGGVWSEMTMPDACYGDPSCAGTACYRSAVPSGLLAFTGTAYPELASCDGPCTCTPDELGSCTVETAFLVGGTPLEASATYVYGDGGPEVELVFE